MKLNKDNKFIILQNDKTRETWIFEGDLGWVEQPPESWDTWVEQHRVIRKFPNTFIQMLGLG